MSIILYVIIAILLLGVLVLVHEFGHFIVARSLGAAVVEFAIGFGPKICKWKRKGTQYSLRCIPLGGYVMFEGDDDLIIKEDKKSIKQKEDAKPEDKPQGKLINDLPWYKRMLIMFAGAGFNILFALIISFFVFTFFGKQVPFISNIENTSPAIVAGIQVNDSITKVNNKSFVNYDEFYTMFKSTAADKTVTFTVDRAGKELIITCPRYTPSADKANILGISVGVVNQKQSFGAAIVQSGRENWYVTKIMFNFLGKLFTGNADVMQNVTGPISTIGAISDIVGQGAQAGVVSLTYVILNLFILISINLAIFNLLPIPSLDGSRMLFLLIEAIRKKPINRELEARIHAGGFIVLIIFVFSLEILKLF